MSKRIFINNLNSYVSQAIFNELRNDIDENGEPNPDANIIYGTYLDKDSSIKPPGINKMLKRSKPRLAMKYLSECDILVYDLHSGNPRDVDLALQALKKHNVEEEKVLILISSLMVWNKTPPKLKEIKEGKEAEEAGEGQEGEDEENPDKEQKEEEKPQSVEEDNISRQGDEEVEGGDQPSQVQQDPINQEPPKPKKYVHLPYLEEDFQARVPSSEYEEIKRIEDEVLEFKKENVKIYVIASGIMYGMGESIFESHFKKAWLQNPLKLPYIGEGKNLVPTVHVKDLARMVKKVYETKPEKQYIFAIDNTRRPTQKKLISAISNGIGTGLVESIDYPDNIKKQHPKKTPLQLDLDWRIPLMLNLKVRPSSLFVSMNEEEEPVEFEWHCKSGLAANIKTAKEEFCNKRGLKPVKICIIGPPAAGKSYFGKQLAEHYNVPHIHLKKMLEEIEHWNEEKETEIFRKREIKRKKQEEEEKIRLEEQKRIEQEKALAKKARIDAGEEDPDKDDSKIKEDHDESKDNAAAEKAKEVDEGQPDGEEGEEKKKNEWDQPDIESESDADYEEIDIKKRLIQFKKENLNQRFPVEMMNEAVRWRLQQNDCQNRGYVLDGYPKTYDQAFGVFYIVNKKPETKYIEDENGEKIPQDEMDEDQLKEFLKPQFQKDIYPDSVIVLRGQKWEIQSQILDKLTNETLKDTHWMPEGHERRFEEWNQNNLVENFFGFEEKGKKPTFVFFQENKTETFEIKITLTTFEILESMRIYIERDGRPYNYLNTVADLNKKREENLVVEETDWRKTNQEQKDKETKENKEKMDNFEKLAEERLKSIREHMKDLESCDKLNQRQFLMKYIIPVLTEGMIEVCKVGPIDPVDYLSDYIFKRSSEFRDQKNH